MQSARLGKSNMRVSRLILGTMNFGTRTDEAESFRIMDRAKELGINFFDTANIYGSKAGSQENRGLTEEIVGRWIAQGGGRRESTILATKVYGPMNREVYSYNDQRGVSGFKLRRQLDDSLRRLQTDYVELYQLHGCDRNANWDDILDTFDVISHQGKAFYLGTANHGGRHLAYAAAAAERKGMLGPVCEQHRYHLLQRMPELEVLPAARDLGMGVITYSPLGGGMLSGAAHAKAGARSAEARKNLSEERLAQIDAFSALCAELGEPEAEVAVAWILTNPNVTGVILGPRTVEQLESSVHAAEIELSQDVLDKLDEVFPPVGEGPESYMYHL